MSIRNLQPASQLSRAAYCDVDGTLSDTTIVSPLIWLKRRQAKPLAGSLWLASLPLRAPWWLLLDCFSRTASNDAIYSNYRGLPAAPSKALGRECFVQCLEPHLFPQGLEALQALRGQGVELVLVTGGLDFLTAPLAEMLSATLLAPALEEAGGVFTGKLTGPALTGAQKATAVRAHAAAHGVALADSYAFGDAIGDLSMLECVGHPVAVNADWRLARVARQRCWRTEQWKA